MTNSKTEPYIFQEGDYVLIIDNKGRDYLIKLNHINKFESHVGNFSHTNLIGQKHGSYIRTTNGHHVIAVKPTMSDYTRKMPRIATVIYPKDLGSILIYGDVFPGARVLEAGSGSGALTITLLRAVSDNGHVISYDIRPDMIKQTSNNVNSFLPNHKNLTMKLGDVYEGFEEDNIDRIILDLPEPWLVVPHASQKLVPGGIFVSFLPTILQVHQLTRCLKSQTTFQLIETFEILCRTWTVSGRSVRPSHKMVGHTGFLTTARKCSPKNSSL